MYEELKRLKDDYVRDLIEYYEAKGITAESIKNMDIMIHSIKNLCKIMDGMDDMGEMHSYRRGRGMMANRDSMGRYASGMYSGTDDMVKGLHDLMNRTHDEVTRRELQDMINKYQ